MRESLVFVFPLLVLVAGAVVSSAAPASRNPGDLPPIKPGRIDEIASWMEEKPVFFCPAFDDRAFWTRLAAQPGAEGVLKAADEYATQPISEVTQELYDDYALTGRRKPFSTPFNHRMTRLTAFVLAKGLTGEGKWLDLIKRELEVVFSEPSWALPAHIGNRRKTWQDARDFADLAATSKVWSLAVADWLLGDRLPTEMRQRLRVELRDRALDPWLERIRAGNKGDYWWMTAGHNWNPVCNSGIVGAGLLVARDARERAEFIAGYESLMPLFLAGFAKDGLCYEGIGYWSYGFGHFLAGAEAVRLATAGRLDLLAPPEVARIAGFVQNWQIVPGVYPAFGDASVRARPSAWVEDFVATRFGFGSRRDHPTFTVKADLGGRLYATPFDVALFSEITKPTKDAGDAKNAPLPLRSWFPHGGALIARAARPDGGLSIAIKGGSNSGPHHHHDVGSFVVVAGGFPVLTDLGVDDYVKGTFGAERFTHDMMGSYGHPVPLVAGRRQEEGSDARAVTVRTEFTDAQDLWEMDLTSAYAEPSLEKLTRTFIYHRAEGGRLEIIDHVRFSSPQTFGTAIVMKPEARRQTTGTLSFRVAEKYGGVVEVVCEALAGGELVLGEAPVRGILANKPHKGVRMGIDLKSPATEAAIRIVITPATSRD